MVHHEVTYSPVASRLAKTGRGGGSYIRNWRGHTSPERGSQVAPLLHGSQYPTLAGHQFTSSTLYCRQIQRWLLRLQEALECTDDVGQPHRRRLQERARLPRARVSQSASLGSFQDKGVVITDSDSGERAGRTGFSWIVKLTDMLQLAKENEISSGESGSDDEEATTTPMTSLVSTKHSLWKAPSWS